MEIFKEVEAIPYENKIVTSDLTVEEIDDFEQSFLKHKKDIEKNKELKNLTVTTNSGKVFYADSESRVDLESAILNGERNNLTETMWKLAKEFNGSRIVKVSIDELKEASMLALQSKGNIVGIQWTKV